MAVWEVGESYQNFPADMPLPETSPLWACFSLSRILLDRSGPGSCPGVLGSVEEGHALLAGRNGLADHWSLWVPLIPQPHMGLPRIDPRDSVTSYPNSNCRYHWKPFLPCGQDAEDFHIPEEQGL